MRNSRVRRGRSLLRIYCVATLSTAAAAILAAALIAPCIAQEAARDTAQAYYEEALYHEMYGRDDQRRELLTAAVATAPEMDLARWQMGELEVDGEWLSYASLMEQAQQDSRLAEYQQRRAAATDAVEDQIALARWCSAYGLRERGRLHWEQVLRLNPNNREAAGRLGLIEYEGRLVTREVRSAIREQRMLQATADRAWRSRLEDCREMLLTDDAAQREAALEQLTSFDNEWAIPMLEEIFLANGGELAYVAVDVLGRLEHPWATESLALLAITTDDTGLRAAAIDQLRARQLYDFAPLLVSGLQFSGEAEPIETPDSSSTNGGEAANANRNVLGQPGVIDLSADSEIGDESITGEQLLNARIIAVLQGVTGRADLTEASAWQGWWYDQISVESVASTSELSESVTDRLSDPFQWSRLNLADFQPSYLHATSSVTSVIVDALGVRQPGPRESLSNSLQEPSRLDAYIRVETLPAPPQELPSQSWRSERSRRPECFVAGTLVWTETGARPIEEVEIGDRVLAKDVDTGELRFQLVTTRTERTAPELVTVVTGRETLVTTPGHMFWVSGQGWKMARELHSGDILHGVEGTDFVSEIRFDQQPQRVYNLVVDRAGTYFVGESQLLVHDATSRQWSQALVPGLVLIEE